MGALPRNTWATPTLDDVREARRSIGAHLSQTPLHAHAGLTELLGTETFVKHENHLPRRRSERRRGS